jgi:putative hydrolase of the HAD superfamily
VAVLVSRPDTQSGENVSVGAVLLDAAGTLIRPSEPVGETYAAVARRCGAELEADKLAQAFKVVFGGMPDLAFEWTSMDELRRLERDWWRRLVHRVVACTGSSIGDFETFFETLYEHYAQVCAWECFPEVPAVLEGLRSRGCKLAVVSNFDSRLPAILQGLGIHGHMDAVIYSSRAGSAKPAPAIFRQALGALGVAPQRAIHVGDSLRADVDGAIAAGLTGLLIRRGHSPATASSQVICSLDQLLVRFGGSDG